MKRLLVVLILLLCTACGGGSNCDAPSWELALEEFLADFLPIFTAAPEDALLVSHWGYWDAGGAALFLNPYTIEAFDIEHIHFYIADPVTGERPDTDTTAYIMARRAQQLWGPPFYITYIATDFRLYEFDASGVPVLFVQWNEIIFPHDTAFSMFRYQEGRFAPVANYDDTDPTLEWPFVFGYGPDFVSMLAKDSKGRILVLQIGGMGSNPWLSKSVLHLEDEYFRTELLFFIRFTAEFSGERPVMLTHAGGPLERQYLGSDRELWDALHTLWQWVFEGGREYSVPVPVLEDVTVERVPRMSEPEQRLTRRITNRLRTEMRILQ